MWTAFASTAVTSSMFLTALGPNLLALGLVRRRRRLTSRGRSGRRFLPVGLLALAPLPFLVYLIYPPEIRSSQEVATWAKAELARIGRLSSQETMMGLTILAGVLALAVRRGLDQPDDRDTRSDFAHGAGAMLDWDDVIGNRAAWDTLIYFATLLALAEGLNRVGIVAWAAQGVSGLLVGVVASLAIIVLVSFFFVIHYMFASLTAHTMAVLPCALGRGRRDSGHADARARLLLVYSIGLMGVITPYATGPAPVYFGSGFIPAKISGSSDSFSV